MSHTVTVKMHSDQLVKIAGLWLNIHALHSIYVDENGQIIDYLFKSNEEKDPE